MSMRITQSMMYSRAKADVQSGLLRYTQLQQQVASGKRISRPSDDPAATLRILPLRNDLRNLDQLSGNVALAQETLNTGAASLEDASALMQRVRELTTQAATGTVRSGDRESIGAEFEQLLSPVVSVSEGLAVLVAARAPTTIETRISWESLAEVTFCILDARRHARRSERNPIFKWQEKTGDRNETDQ